MALIEFWDSVFHDVDMKALCASSIPVKGKAYSNPCRLLEIYGNTTNRVMKTFHRANHSYTDEQIAMQCFPYIPGVTVSLGEGVYHPPFVWNDCEPEFVAHNFTYTTNAIYRILNNLAENGVIQSNCVDNLLDDACLLITQAYRSNGGDTIRWINNNINMFMVSKVIEIILGKEVYDSKYQEVELTTHTLQNALDMVKEHINLTPKQQMALALGKGIAFLEKHSGGRRLTLEVANTVREIAYQYTEKGMVIDDRDKLLDRIYSSKGTGNNITMCVILDDTAESVDDLLWIQQLLESCPHFYVTLLLNTAQVSVNFANHMLEKVIKSPFFSTLASSIGGQVKITRTYCPLISFQSNLLDVAARNAIDEADIVFVKGLNFFETCQISHKDVFHSFVVYGPVSRLYTGYDDFAGIFTFIPAGLTGYQHNEKNSDIVSLKAVYRRPVEAAEVSHIDKISKLEQPY